MPDDDPFAVIEDEPAAITNPPPLNPRDFPFRVESLPIDRLMSARVLPIVSGASAPTPNPHRFE